MSGLILKISLTATIICLIAVITSRYEVDIRGDIRWITAFIGMLSLAVSVISTLINIWI